MLGKTHIKAGVAISLLLYPNFSHAPISFACSMAGIMFGSLLVDIDSKNSIISKRLNLNHVRSNKSNSANHRSFIHTPMFTALYTLFMLFLGQLFLAHTIPKLYNLYYLWVIGTAIGMLGHLFLDSLNPTGIKWLYPLSTKNYKFLSIPVGTKGELICRLILNVLIVIALLRCGIITLFANY